FFSLLCVRTVIKLAFRLCETKICSTALAASCLKVSQGIGKSFNSEDLLCLFQRDNSCKYFTFPQAITKASIAWCRWSSLVFSLSSFKMVFKPHYIASLKSFAQAKQSLFRKLEPNNFLLL